MTENKRFRVHDLVKFNYSEIGEYIGEGYTDKPLRNDEIVDLLNSLNDENEELKKELESFKPIIFESDFNIFGKTVTLYRKGDVE